VLFSCNTEGTGIRTVIINDELQADEERLGLRERESKERDSGSKRENEERERETGHVTMNQCKVRSDQQ
jgi:hypothetical protein